MNAAATRDIQPHASSMEPQQGSYRLIALVVASTFFMALLDGVIINTALPRWHCPSA